MESKFSSVNSLTIWLQIIFCYAVFSSLVACSSYGPKYTPINLTGEKESVIYIYRPDKLAFYLRTAYLEIDNTPLAELNNNGYTAVVVKPGKHIIRQNWSGWVFDNPLLHEFLEIEINALGGEEIYVQLYPEGGPSRDFLVIQWSLERVSKSKAIDILKNCRYQANLLSK